MVILVRAEGQRQVVAARCARAAEAGVRVGMPAAEARAILPPKLAAAGLVRIAAIDDARNAALLRALAGWAQRFSPTISIEGSDTLMADVSGCERVFKGESRLVGKAVRDAAALGFSARVVIAPTFAGAWALAHFGPAEACARGLVVDRAGLSERLEHVPVRALGLDEKTQAGLAEVGIERIGELARMPRGSLPARFDEFVLLKLDMALGNAMETITPVRLRGVIEAERSFEGPTTRVEGIAQAAREVLEDLSRALLARESGVRRLELVLERADLEPAKLELELSAPSRDVRHLWGLIAPRLERVHLGYGVERVKGRAAKIGKLAHEQECAWDERADRDAERAGTELIDVLGGRLGLERVWRVERVESHIPERSWRKRQAARDGERQGDAGGTPDGPSSGGMRPTVVLPVPELVRVLAVTPDGPVASVAWGGEELRIDACEGPERIGGEWWRDDRPARDYFRVRDQHGRWLWLCRELARGRWFVHGVWA